MGHKHQFITYFWTKLWWFDSNQIMPKLTWLGNRLIEDWLCKYVWLLVRLSTSNIQSRRVAWKNLKRSATHCNPLLENVENFQCNCFLQLPYFIEYILHTLGPQINNFFLSLLLYFTCLAFLDIPQYRIIPTKVSRELEIVRSVHLCIVQ